MYTPFMDNRCHRRAGAGAGGRLKQRLAQLLVRSSCTTNTTTITTTSATAIISLDNTNADLHREAPPSPYLCTPCTYQRPKPDGGRRSRRRRSASLVHIYIDCAGEAGAGAVSGRRSTHSDAPLLRPSLPTSSDANKQRQGRSNLLTPSASRRHHCSSASWGRARLPRRRTPAAYSWSSSTVTDDELGPFSTGEESGGEAETRTLFSSLSFSSDSTSEFYHTNSISVANRKNHRHRTAPRRAARHAPEAFRPLVSVETRSQECNGGKEVGGEEAGGGAGMAVVKRSSNPFADFRSSMVEMVVERRIGSVGGMEELLGSYLSLNSPQHHPAILAAFEDVWEAVFGEE